MIRGPVFGIDFEDLASNKGSLRCGGGALWIAPSILPQLFI
jgi:hypothetical protein